LRRCNSAATLCRVGTRAPRAGSHVVPGPHHRPGDQCPDCVRAPPPHALTGPSPPQAVPGAPTASPPVAAPHVNATREPGTRTPPPHGAEPEHGSSPGTRGASATSPTATPPATAEAEPTKSTTSTATALITARPTSGPSATRATHDEPRTTKASDHAERPRRAPTPHPPRPSPTPTSDRTDREYANRRATGGVAPLAHRRERRSGQGLAVCTGSELSRASWWRSFSVASWRCVVPGPDPAVQRRRRNVPKKEADRVVLPREGRKTTIPKPRTGAKLHALSRDMWRAWWRSPMATQWDTAPSPSSGSPITQHSSFRPFGSSPCRASS
jgi:hypothetical protein